MRVAVIGAGIMGAGMAGSLAREGHDVVVWNRTRSKAEALGHEVAGSVTDAVTGADAVVSVLFDIDATLAVADELVAALGPDAVWLQTSTVGPDGIKTIAEKAGAARDRLLDAPVLGTKKPAEDGNLVILLAGPEAARTAAQPVLDAIGSRTVVAGEELGAGSALKLVCNSWVAMLTVGTGQAVALAEAQGLDPQLFLDAVKGGLPDSPYAHLKGPQMIAGDYDDVSFTLDGLRKDLALMVDVAQQDGVDPRVLEAVLAVGDAASERGHGAEDIGAVRTGF